MIYDGKIYGEFVVIEIFVLYYNKDLVDIVLVMFKDLENLFKDSCFVFELEVGKNIGFLVKWIDFYYFYGLIVGYGGYVFGDDGIDFFDIGLNNVGVVEGIFYVIDWF